MMHSPGRKQIRVLIVEDHDGVRAGIRGILKSGKDIRVVGEAADGAQAVELANEERPDVVLLDLELPVLKGEAVMTRVLARNSDIRILILTSHDDPLFARSLLAKGAAGYMLKEDAPRSLLQAIRTVELERGARWISPRLLG